MGKSEASHLAENCLGVRLVSRCYVLRRPYRHFGLTRLIEEPKSHNGKRTLPLDDELVAALTRLRKRQMDESATAGAAYQAELAGLGWYQGGEYVVTDELGLPVHPEWYSDEFGRLLKRAGLRRITLHDSRHTTLTLMEHAGVPISIVSKWAGHYDSAFTQKTYVHASGDDLQRGRAALAKIHKTSRGKSSQSESA
jgi:integrase